MTKLPPPVKVTCKRLFVSYFHQQQISALCPRLSLDERLDQVGQEYNVRAHQHRTCLAVRTEPSGTTVPILSSSCLNPVFISNSLSCSRSSSPG